MVIISKIISKMCIISKHGFFHVWNLFFCCVISKLAKITKAIIVAGWRYAIVFTSHICDPMQVNQALLRGILSLVMNKNVSIGQNLSTF